MQVTETQIDELTRQFHVAVPAADIERKVASRLQELAQSARLPGFRPGKVPLSLLRKRYGPSVKSEAVEEVISESSQTVISERGLRPALPPRYEIAALPDDGDLEYTMAVEVLPDITPPDYTQIQLERLVADVDEGEIDRRVGQIAEVFGEDVAVADARPIGPGDVVGIKVVGPEDRWPFEDNSDRTITVRVGEEWPIPGLADQLVGHSQDGRAVVSLAFEEGAERKDLAGKSKEFDVEICTVSERKPADVDDALAQKAGAESLEDLKERLRQQFQNELKQLSRMKIKRGLLDRLADMYAFAVPPGLVEREYQSLVRQSRQEDAETGEDGAEAAHDHADCDHDHHDHDHDHHDHQHDHDHGHHDHDHDHDHGHHDHDHDHATASTDTGGEPPIDESELRALAERRVRLGLVLAEIARLNNVRVSQEEIGRALVSEARRYRGQEQAVLEYLRKTPAAQEALAAPILEDKVVDFVLEMANVTERTISPEALLREAEEATKSETHEARTDEATGT